MDILTKKTKEELIEEKKMEIEKIKAEIKELRGPIGLAQMVHNKMICFKYKWAGDHSECVRIGFDEREKIYRDSSLWNHIYHICFEVHRKEHADGNITFKRLSNREKAFSAKMADEIIDIWNKYVVRLYGDCIDTNTLEEYNKMKGEE